MKRKYQKQYKRKSAATRRRTYARKRLSFGTNINNMIYPYKQYCDTALLTHAGMESSNLSDVGRSWQFALDMVPQYQTFVALYDQYRIVQIEFTVRPRAHVVLNLNTGQGQLAERIYSSLIMAIDTDDANNVASYNELRQYGTAKEYELSTGKKIVKIFKPAVAANLYNNGITTAHSERSSPWIDCANAGVPHYGVKCALPMTHIIRQTVFDVTARYLLEFRQVR